MQSIQTESQIIEQQWKALIKELSLSYGEELDMQAILYIIGLQELGHNFRKFTKDQKLDIMHVAVCTLLQNYGYYTFEGRDNENWPHFKVNENLPSLKAGQQLYLMKEAVLSYFNKN